MSRSIDEPTLALPVSDQRDHILGSRDATITLLEYGDFECPQCGRAHYLLKELLPHVEDWCRYAFRNFPLTQVHPHAERAAEAAEAAAGQGRYWEMHDTLYENQDALQDEDLVGYAQQLGLDLERFQLDLIQSAYAPRVREDFISGVRSGVNGTPTFFINGRRHDGAWDANSLLAAMRAATQYRDTGQHRGRGHHRPHV
jgi:protein-disulfide isomerase